VADLGQSLEIESLAFEPWDAQDRGILRQSLELSSVPRGERLGVSDSAEQACRQLGRQLLDGLAQDLR
jgi:hypothetical protein